MALMPGAALHTVVWPLLAAPFVGSVLGVLVRRLPAGLPVVLDRSRCEHCGHPLRPVELVPVLSFLWQRGRCRHCGAAIARQHLWMELAALAVPASAAWFEPDGVFLWADCLLGWMLLALAVIDWTHLRLPDALTLPLLLAGLAEAAWLEPGEAADRAWAAALGYGVLRLLGLAYRWLRGRDGLGGGDAKLFAASGAWVGLAGLGPTLGIAAAAGFAAALVRGKGLRAHTMVPLGSCLALGTWAVRLLLP